MLDWEEWDAEWEMLGDPAEKALETKLAHSCLREKSGRIRQAWWVSPLQS